MKIPKSFELFGQTIRVNYDDAQCKKGDCYGYVIWVQNSITLSETDDEYKVCDEHLSQTFLHEFYHFVLKKSGYNNLADNEVLVNSLANAHQQLYKTAKY